MCCGVHVSRILTPFQGSAVIAEIAEAAAMGVSRLPRATYTAHELVVISACKGAANKMTCSVRWVGPLEVVSQGERRGWEKDVRGRRLIPIGTRAARSDSQSARGLDPITL